MCVKEMYNDWNRDIRWTCKKLLKDIRMRHNLPEDKEFDCEYLNDLERLLKKDPFGG